MSYIRRKSRNVGFHSRRHMERAAVGEVHRVLTKVASFGLTLVTVKRKPEAYKRIAETLMQSVGPEELGLVQRPRRPGVLSLPEASRSATPWINGALRRQARVQKLRANSAARMGEG
jgi:hypothetical protein